MWYPAAGEIVKVWLPPQLTVFIPDGEMVPLAPAEAVMVKALIVKFALHVFAPFITMFTGVVVPAQSPDQPVKVEHASGVADRLTVELFLYIALHDAPQLIPAGVLVMVPLPVPDFETDKAGPEKVTTSDGDTVLLAPPVSIAL